MKELKNIMNPALKYCRYWILFTKSIVLIVCLFFIYTLYEDNIYHTMGQANVTSAKCIQNVKTIQSRYSSYNELYNDCKLTIKYKVNSKEYHSNLRTLEGKYNDGDIIDIDYENENINNIRLHEHYKKYVFYGSILILLISLSILFVIIYYPDKVWVKWLIGIMCFRSLTN